MSQLPWNVLQTFTLRSVLSDLGLTEYTKSRRRSDLAKLLHEISMDGLEAITQELKDGTYATNYPRHTSPAPRNQSPEIEYEGPSPRSVPYVEIPSPARPKAGPSRVRTRARSETSVSASPSPPPKKLKVPPPSYAILYQQHQEIAPPSKEPFALLNPHLKFDGVYIPAPRHRIRRLAEKPAHDRAEEPEPERVSPRRVNDGVEGVANGRPRATDGTAGSSSSPKRIQPVVLVSHLAAIVSPSARKAGPNSRHAYSDDY